MSAPLAAIQPVSAALRAYGTAPTAGADFGAMVGDADVQEVVQAAANAELTVQTMTQLRDKVVSAYMDVLRMAV